MDGEDERKARRWMGTVDDRNRRGSWFLLRLSPVPVDRAGSEIRRGPPREPQGHCNRPPVALNAHDLSDLVVAEKATASVAWLSGYQINSQFFLRGSLIILL